jgi:hypothetical protein
MGWKYVQKLVVVEHETGDVLHYKKVRMEENHVDLDCEQHLVTLTPVRLIVNYTVGRIKVVVVKLVVVGGCSRPGLYLQIQPTAVKHVDLDGELLIVTLNPVL